MSWEYIENEVSLVEELKEDGWEIILAEQVQGSIWLQDFEFIKNHKYVIIFGNEVDGVQPLFLPLANAVVEIPQVGSKHSLNVSVCAGIVMWEFAKRLID